MFDRDVLPVLRQLSPVARESRVYRIYGVPESAVDERMRPLVRRHKSRGGLEVVWGILAHGYIVDVKFAVGGRDASAARRLAARIEAEILRLFGREIYGRGRETLEEVVGRLLAARNKTLAAAESCTGGLVAQKITRVPGSSAYFEQGVVTYSNAAKERLLGVRRSTLIRHGAVSKACALEMARGVQRRAGTDYGLSITGIAGPEGGTAEKPVGLVHIALAGPGGAVGVEYRFPGERELVRERSALAALDLLRRRLLGL
jgi:nicotinamide-nucleotide amidase